MTAAMVPVDPGTLALVWGVVAALGAGATVLMVLAAWRGK